MSRKIKPGNKIAKKEGSLVALTLTEPEWERQDQETLMAFDAFKYFRDMKMNRNLADVARHFAADDEDIYKAKYSAVCRWSTKYKWAERVSKYQKWLDSIYLEETKSKVKEMATRHADYAEQTIEALYMPIMRFGAKNKKINEARQIAKITNQYYEDEDDDLDEMKLSQLLNLVFRSAPLLNIAADMERKARGEATEISKSDVTSAGESIKPNINILIKGTHSPLMQEFEEQIANG
jgi:coenzyme F420-reducing hydrogenase delta subunit